MVADPTTGRQRADADVIVVGAGPAGSTAATYLARAGLDVLLLEKSTFPRTKVCGDGLHPARRQADHRPRRRLQRGGGLDAQQGLRVLGGGVSLELTWPTLATFPDFGAVRPRQDFDEMLVRHAEKSGARLHEDTTVTDAVTRRAHRPGHRGHRARRPGQGQAAGHLPRPAHPGLRRRVGPARAQHGHHQARRPADGRRRPPLLPQPAGRTTTTWRATWSCGTGRTRRTPSSCPATAGSSGWATARSTSGSASCPPAARTGPPTTGPCCAAGWTARPRSGASARRTPRAPIGGAALPMGFNRTPHYRRRDAAGRRRGRRW